MLGNPDESKKIGLRQTTSVPEEAPGLGQIPKPAGEVLGWAALNDCELAHARLHADLA